MRPVSDAFNRVIKGSYQMVTRVRVLEEFQTGINPVGEFIDIETGDVKLTARGEVRSTVDMTVLGIPWTNKPSGPVVPYGNEVFIEVGILYGNGDGEVISLGYHRITSAESNDVKSKSPGAIRIMASDRMQKIIAARLTSPRVFYPGHTVRQVFDSIVSQVFPDAVIEYDFDPDAVALTSMMVAEQNRYEFLRDVAAAFGKTLYFDYRGVLVVKSRPEPTIPVYEAAEGKDGLLVDLARSLSIEGVYNAVCARGESVGAGEKPVQAVAYDNDPLSPTYYRGKFGKVPRFYASPLLKSRQQCRDAARAILRGSVGVPYRIDFSMVPNPALEPDDPVRVVGPDRTEIHILDELSVPLMATAGAMTAATREQTNLIVGYEDAELD